MEFVRILKEVLTVSAMDMKGITVKQVKQLAGIFLCTQTCRYFP